MDRFIDLLENDPMYLARFLKSNMDRFIEKNLKLYLKKLQFLKSNMDRFIGDGLSTDSYALSIFKIQYG